jgi:hypothetical protein
LPHYLHHLHHSCRLNAAGASPLLAYITYITFITSITLGRRTGARRMPQAARLRIAPPSVTVTIPLFPAMTTIFVIQQRRSVNHDELVVVGSPKLSTR